MWTIVLLLSLLMALIAGRYLTLNPEVYFPQQKTVYMANSLMLVLHVAGSMLATLTGPFQFLRRSRTGRWLGVHRWSGRVYLAGVLIGGMAGLYMATLAHGGPYARLGFGALAVLWLYTGWMAYARARAHDIDSHRDWMIRNFALTFAAVTLRLWQIVFQSVGLEFDTGYVMVAWLSWIPNLLVAAWIIRRGA